MPTYSKRFQEAGFYEHTIMSEDDQGGSSKFGTIRIKPVSVLWKPKGSQSFYAVSLEKFEEWIKAEGRKVDK